MNHFENLLRNDVTYVTGKAFHSNNMRSFSSSQALKTPLQDTSAALGKRKHLGQNQRNSRRHRRGGLDSLFL